MKASYTLFTLAIAATGLQQARAETEPIVLETIEVMARKQTERLQDVPMAVSAVTAEQIQAAGIRDVADLTAVAPSLVVTSNSNPFNTSYRIRRIGNEGNIPDFEPDTGLFIDGAYRSRSGLGLGDLADIEQIEVLRGPQSTLQGRNVTAGAISVRTALPSQTFGAMGELTAGNDALMGVRSYVTGGLTDSISARLSVTGTSRDAIADNLLGADSDDLNQYSVRGQLLFEPSDAWQVRLIGSHTDRDMKPALAEMFYGPGVRALVNATVANPAALGAADGPGLADGVINAAAQPILDNDPLNRKVQALAPLEFVQQSDDVMASVEYSADRFTLTSISSYDTYDIAQSWNDAGQTGLDLVNYRDAQNGDTFSQELRINSAPGGALSWLGGSVLLRQPLRARRRGSPRVRPRPGHRRARCRRRTRLAGAAGRARIRVAGRHRRFPGSLRQSQLRRVRADLVGRHGPSRAHAGVALHARGKGQSRSSTRRSRLHRARSRRCRCRCAR